jgi:hypothetical protein
VRTDRLIIGLVVLTFLAVYTAVVFGFFSAPEGETQLVYLALIGVPLGLAMVAFPQVALILLGALVHSVDWLSEQWTIVPREATWLIDILIVILLARTALFMPAQHQRIRRIEGLIYLLLAFAFIAALVDGLGKLTVFVGLRVGFRYVLLFVAAYHLNVSRRWLRGYIIYLFLIGLVQTPVVLVQFHYLGWIDPDTLCGTFGRSQTPGVAIFLLTLFCYLAARTIEERRIRISYFAILVWMSVSPLLGEAKFYFMFLPLLILFLVRSEFIKRPFVAISLFMVGIGMIYAVDFIIVATGGWKAGRNPLTYMKTLPDVFSKEMQEPQTERYERTYRFVYALRLAAESPRMIFLGSGTGSITHSYVAQDHSPVANYYARWGLSSSAATIPWMLIEYGYVGTALFMLLLWLIFRRGRVLRLSQDLELRVYGRMLEGMTFLYVAWLFYANAWQSDNMNFIYWPLAGMFVYWSYQEEQAQLQAATAERLREIRPAGREYAPHAAP